MQINLEPTPLLDFRASKVAELIQARGWHLLISDEAKIRAVYDFVRNEIQFGYNASDDIPASAVLADGYGQCNTKTTLLMALLRGVGIACRFHGATLDKALQRGAVSGLWYVLAPNDIIHSWAEVHFKGNWIKLEGVIIDDTYLNAVQKQVATSNDAAAFIGYGIATKNIADPAVEWTGQDTAIQKEGVNHDLGVYDAPDAFYRAQGVNMTPVKRLMFSYFIRHRLNARVGQIRDGRLAIGKN